MPTSAADHAPDMSVGFARVDAQPQAAMMVAGMDATAQWPAVRYLRSWERERLALQTGDRVADIGCGTGDVTIAMASRVAPTGSVVGVDASEGMLTIARGRAKLAAREAAFQVADAQELPWPDGELDACRSERMLQWIPDSALAFREMVRILRPGGRLVVIDTDWRSLAVDRVDPGDLGAVNKALHTLRGPSYDVGGRLLNMFRDAGLFEIQHAVASHVWTSWNPDLEPVPAGLFPLRIVIPELAEKGLLPTEIAERFVRQVENSAREDRLCAYLTMFAVYARRPER